MIPLYRVHMPPGVLEPLREVLFSGYVADGQQSRRFEEALGAYLGNPLVTTHDNVSTALMLALYMAGVRPGDEVIASPMVCLATNQPVLNLFARVVWVDVDPMTGIMNPADISGQVGPRTKAILCPHWGGDVAELDRIHEVAARHSLRVVEDASEAMGAEYRGRKIGACGSDFTVFSFHAVRHITTGEGAAIAFSDEEDYGRAKRLKHYGIDQSTFRDGAGEINPASDVPEAGYNSYMTNIAATIGLEQMKHVNRIVGRHRANGEYYEETLGEVPGIRLLRRLAHARSSYWVYTLLAERRDDLLRALRDRGVYASKAHIRNDIYSCFGRRDRTLPGLDSFSASYLCIPSGHWVSDEDRAHIVDAIRAGW